MMFTDYLSGGPMWTGEGLREVRHPVSFDPPFVSPPVVMVAISLWDSDRHTNLRADLSADKISATGFELVFRTWSDSRLARLRADWTAFGPIRDEEDWQID